ncbi:WhiB family transcriptional regulator [Pseudonocardia pini]|uniref:WhiB family transcriptional regulator n=1 Tax=Pseudonocardia pini TaxID=2758030 RepID=UPI0015F0FAAC|nr:WhiB family transcriptional regulator [Pseudonocardia pini]
MADTRWIPTPVVTAWDWQLRASCRGLATELFFAPDQERSAHRAKREARAKLVCRECPVIERCRYHARAAAEAYGIWGGLSEKERAAVTGHRSALSRRGCDDRGRPAT